MKFRSSAVISVAGFLPAFPDRSVKVFLIRHAEAIDREEFEGPDLARPLTQRGRSRGKKAFAGLRRIVSSLDYVYFSAAIRSVQTADLLYPYYKKAVWEKTSVLNPGAEYPEFWRILSPHSGTTRRIAVIGHEPDLSECATGLILSSLASCSEDHEVVLPMVLKKAGIMELTEADDSSFYLSGLYASRVLRRLGE